MVVTAAFVVIFTNLVELTAILAIITVYLLLVEVKVIAMARLKPKVIVLRRQLLTIVAFLGLAFSLLQVAKLKNHLLLH